jgi:hypothetical protein
MLEQVCGDPVVAMWVDRVCYENRIGQDSHLINFEQFPVTPSSHCNGNSIKASAPSQKDYWGSIAITLITRVLSANA